jgi:ABC-2 type transport system permease protein
MNKYWQIFKTYWSAGLVYRTNLFMWRFRQLLLTLMSLTIWTVLFTNQNQLFGYSQAQMVGYVFITSIIQSVILATSLHGLAYEIYSGYVSMQLLRPQKIFGSLASVELADKLKNLMFSLVEGFILLLIIKPAINFPNMSTLLVFLISLILATLIYFYICILFGTIGFWSPEVWAPKFLFFIIIDFTAGRLFPLDILPALARKILALTPFPTLIFIPTQIFLNKFTWNEIWQNLGTQAFWAILLWFIATRLWKRGLKSYEAAGS